MSNHCQNGRSFVSPRRPGKCDEQTECRESQEFTYAWDNTFTHFGWDAEYEIEWSDGTITPYTQTATGSWSAQLTQWSGAAQAAVNGVISAFFEPRYVDSGANGDPTSIDGTINGPGGTPSGLPGAPSSQIAVQLIDQGMSYRYVNVQICPGEPVPVAVRLISVTNQNGVGTVPKELPFDLTTTNAAIKGPKRKFQVCITCGEEKWLIYDPTVEGNYREPLASELPKCWEPCGTLITAPDPPESECVFDLEVGCDDVGSADDNDWVTVTRRAKICNGREIETDFLVEDPGGPALVLYNGGNGTIGQFVDCASGEPIPEPEPECGELTSVGTLWQIDGNPAPGTDIDWWAPSNFPAGSNAAPHDDVSNIFSVTGGTLTHINGAPDVSYVHPTFDVPGTSSAAFLTAVGAASTAETNGTDQLKLSGYIILKSPAVLKDTNANTGERGGLWVNQCCAGELENVFEQTTNTASGNTGVFDGVKLPAGIHYIEAVTSDLSAWQGLQLSVSFDDGETFEPFVSYTSKPAYKCIKVMKCQNSGRLVNAEDDSTVTVGPFDTWCEPKGCADCCGGDDDTQTLRIIP